MIVERQRIIDAAQTILKVAEGISTEESRKADNYDGVKKHVLDMVVRMFDGDSDKIRDFAFHASMHKEESIDDLELGELVYSYIKFKVKMESEEAIQGFKNSYLGTLR